MDDQEEELEPTQLDPRELEALQRASEHTLGIDDDSSPEAVVVSEIPAAAEQPDPPVPEIAAPDVRLPEEEPRGPLKDLPSFDISSTPPQRKLSAWQKRHGQKEPPPPQPMPGPEPAAEQPPPAKPAKLEREDLKGLLDEARRVGAFDEKEEVVAWDKFLGQDNGQRLGNADNTVGDFEEAFQNLADRVGKLLAAATETVRDLAQDVDKHQTEQIRIRNGNLRSRG